MGTRWSALFYAPDGFDVVALERALVAAVTSVDRQMSTWKDDSDLMRLNAALVDQWVDVPPELAFVLAAGLEVGRASEECFDIGVGDLVNAWGFGAATAEPDTDAVEAGLRRLRPATYDMLKLDVSASRACKLAPLALDLSGIAKGFGVDELARVMREAGIAHALIGLDGEMRAIGLKPDQTPWAVAVEKPDYDARSAMAVVTLQDAAIATSGDYRHWVDVGSARLSHSMDSRLGGPALGSVASVSVIAERCMMADAWATALLVAGEKRGLALARKHGLDALFVLRDGASLRQVATGGVFAAG
jgi:thiamine biosynthesis lipoprotein